MSSPQFHALRVKEIRKETADSVSIAFEIPEELKNAFTYQAGQYITIKKNIEGEDLRRSYSLCSSPVETDFRVAIKQVEGGKFSTFANSVLSKGDELDVMTPMGNFVSNLDQQQAKHTMAFAAGSGITPILSLLKSTLSTNATSTFTLVYGNQQVQSIMFREEIEALKNKYLGRLHLLHILSRERLECELNFGRIGAEKCAQIFEQLVDLNEMDEFFLCGPEEMILSVKEFLLHKGVAESKVRFELFNSSSATEKKKAYQESHQADKGKMSTVTIKVDDRSMDIQLAYDGDSILDAALKQGADLPFACKGGVCCTCRAKVIEGSVNMEVNYALEKEEVDNGFILTCQAHPTSDRVVVDFDAR